MPRLTDKLPSYRKHKPSGQAVVTLTGKDCYLGPYGTQASRLQYDRLIGEWMANGRRAPGEPKEEITVVELCAQFWDHAKRHYVKNGKPTAEQHCIKSALKPLKELYGKTPVTEFGPLALKAVRQKMVEPKIVCRKLKSGITAERTVRWSRKYINKAIGRIRLMFKYGVETELVPVTIYQALLTVPGLQAGRTEARETPGRHPVPQEQIEAVKAVLRRQRPRDLIDLGLLTGARPGELLALTTNMIDQSKPVWTAKLDQHKTIHQGKERTLFFGPRAQLILRRYLSGIRPDKRLFPIRRDCYAKTIAKACGRAGVPRWTPHWLRHSCGTQLRQEFGPEAAQVLLGHSQIQTTELYAQKNLKLAIEIAQRVG